MNRVLPAIVMILVVGFCVVGHVVTGFPFLLLLLVAVYLLCHAELMALFHCCFPVTAWVFGDKSATTLYANPLGRDAILIQSNINSAGIVAAGFGTLVLFLDGATTVTLPWLGAVSVPSNLLPLLLIMISAILFENTIAWAAGKSWRSLKKALNWRSPRAAYPIHSPNKTVVGSLAGVVGAIILGVWLVTAISAEMSRELYVLLMVLAIMTPPLAEWGDWVESRMKRLSGVKNSNDMIFYKGTSAAPKTVQRLESAMGDHGGFVDRTDSLFFCLA
ncbi:phosphatidate cytidylyltransferase [Candidatus Saccharibacteria bacterium]|nr:phosphatidate cytidylyltransferase [Candidatus Saccharibacteria bacterium]